MSLEINAAICYECRTVIVSRTRHDFVSCNCSNDGGIFVDGGLDYQRFGWGHDNYRTFVKKADLDAAWKELTDAPPQT